MRGRFPFISLIVIATLMLGACAPAATEAPATTAAAAFTCSDKIGCVTIAPGHSLHLAYIQSVSGPAAFVGKTNVNAAQIALDDINNMLLGHKISFTGEDSLCSAEGGQAAGAKIAADPTVVAILGTTCSSEARSAMPLIFKAGMTMISSSNTNPDLTSPAHPDHHPGYFRTAHNDLFQGRLAADFAYNQLKVTTAATIHDGSSVAKSQQQAFVDNFKNLGGTITTQEAVNVGATDFKLMLTKIASGKPALIYFPIFEPEGDLLASQKCGVAGLETTIAMGADGLLATVFPKTSGKCALNMYLSGTYLSAMAQADFLTKYKAKFGEGPASVFAPHSYDAMNILFAAIKTVAVQDSEGTLHIGRQALRDAMYTTKGFKGLTGNLACDQNGDCATGEALAVFQISQAMIDGTADLPASTPFWQPGKP